MCILKGLVAAYIHGLCDMATATAEEQSESSDGTGRAGRHRSSAGVAGGSSRQRQQRLSRSSADDEDDEDDERDGREDDTQDMFSARNLPQLQRVRDSILDILVERAHDKSYYTRTTVLKVCKHSQRRAQSLRGVSWLSVYACGLLNDECTAFAQGFGWVGARLFRLRVAAASSP